MYRDVVSVAKSMYRASMLLPSLRLVYVFGRLSGQMSNMMMDLTGINGRDFRVRMDSDLTYGVLVFALSTKTYLDMRRRGFDITALRYEDLVARPLDMCRVILEFCHLPVSLAELAVKALDVDSQRNTLVSKSMIGHFNDPHLTPETKSKLNELLKQYGAPLIGEPSIIEGTLGYL